MFSFEPIRSDLVCKLRTNADPSWVSVLAHAQSRSPCVLTRVRYFRSVQQVALVVSDSGPTRLSETHHWFSSHSGDAKRPSLALERLGHAWVTVDGQPSDEI